MIAWLWFTDTGVDTYPVLDNAYLEIPLLSGAYQDPDCCLLLELSPLRMDSVSHSVSHVGLPYCCFPQGHGHQSCALSHVGVRAHSTQLHARLACVV